MSLSKQDILIIGSGWAGSTLATSLDEIKYSITVVSPEATTPYTPLLASAACGLYDYSLVETPIRHTGKRIKYIKARVLDIDFKGKNAKCQAVFEDAPSKEFELRYDIVVVAPGVSPILSIPPNTKLTRSQVRQPNFRHPRSSRERSLPPKCQRRYDSLISSTKLLRESLHPRPHRSATT